MMQSLNSSREKPVPSMLSTVSSAGKVPVGILKKKRWQMNSKLLQKTFVRI